MQKQPSTGKAEWTVLCYLAGQNDLSNDMVLAMNRMKQVGSLSPTGAGSNSSKKVNLLAQFASDGIGIPSQRFYLTKTGRSGRLFDDAVDSRVVSPRVEKDRLGGEYSGAPAALLDFIRWGVDHYPARHYMLVISGHGSGVEEDFLAPAENGQDAISLVELRAVLLEAKERIGKKVDLVGMDTCLMSMGEVCLMLRSSTDYLVGSEGFEPNSGWPYHKILGYLVNCSRMGRPVRPEDLARTVVTRYITYYKDYVTSGVSSHMAACRLNEANRFFDRLDELGDVLSRHLQIEPIRDALLLSHWEAQGYKGDHYVDVFDLGSRLLMRLKHLGHILKRSARTRLVHSSIEETIEAASRVRHAIRHGSGGMVVKSQVYGPAFQYSNGVSIYFPWAWVSDRYVNISQVLQEKALNRPDSRYPGRSRGWEPFLRRYVEATRRAPRFARHHRLPPGPETVQGEGSASAGPQGAILPGQRFVEPFTRFEQVARLNEIGSMKNPPLWYDGDRVIQAIRES